MFDGVPTSIDLEAVRAELAALPGVACVSDLHVWATGTTEVALTAHLVMPDGHPDDAFFRAAADAHARALRDRPRHPAGGDRDADDAVRRAVVAAPARRASQPQRTSALRRGR